MHYSTIPQTKSHSTYCRRPLFRLCHRQVCKVSLKDKRWPRRGWSARSTISRWPPQWRSRSWRTRRYLYYWQPRILWFPAHTKRHLDCCRLRPPACASLRPNIRTTPLAVSCFPTCLSRALRSGRIWSDSLADFLRHSCEPKLMPTCHMLPCRVRRQVRTVRLQTDRGLLEL